MTINIAMWIAGSIALVFWVLAGIAWYEDRNSISFYDIPALANYISVRVAAIATVSYLLLVLFR